MVLVSFLKVLKWLISCRHTTISHKYMSPYCKLWWDLWRVKFVRTKSSFSLHIVRDCMPRHLCENVISFIDLQFACIKDMIFSVVVHVSMMSQLTLPWRWCSTSRSPAGDIYFCDLCRTKIWIWYLLPRNCINNYFYYYFSSLNQTTLRGWCWQSGQLIIIRRRLRAKSCPWQNELGHKANGHRAEQLV